MMMKLGLASGLHGLAYAKQEQRLANMKSLHGVLACYFTRLDDKYYINKVLDLSL